MFNLIFRSFVFAIAICLLSACDTQPQKTDSMLRREKADVDALEYVNKAKNLVTQSVLTSPSEHLDELTLAKQAVWSAKNVYKEARILNWDNPQLVELDSTLLSLNQKLAQSSIDALSLALDKTREFKQAKIEVETLPVYDNTVAKQGLQRSLVAFNQDLNACCIQKASTINRFLQEQRKQYRGLIKLNHNALLYLSQYVQDEMSEREIRDMIAEAQLALEQQTLEQAN